MPEKQPYSAREIALREALKEVGVWLGRLSCNGDFNPAIAASLEKARSALRQ